jgi:hypothetical protein
VVGPNRLPTFEDADKLPYLTAVISECFRWKHFAPFGIPHSTTEVSAPVYINCICTPMHFLQHTISHPLLMPPSHPLLPTHPSPPHTPLLPTPLSLCQDTSIGGYRVPKNAQVIFTRDHHVA